jgi:hypothetical protein
MRLGFRELMDGGASPPRLLALGIALVVLLVGCTNGDQGTTTTVPVTSTSAGRELPESPPDEALAPRMQLLYRQCDDGDDEACTELATLADEGSAEYRFAVTCGERETAPLCAPPEE